MRRPRQELFRSHCLAWCGAGLLVAAWMLPPVAAAAGPDFAAGSQDAFRAAGPQAAHVLDLWRLTTWICSLVFAGVLIAFLYALWRAPRARESTPADISTLNRDEPGARRSVLAAVVVSTCLLFVLIVASVLTDRALAGLAVRDALHIELTAHQWWWEARYDDAEPSRVLSTANELHIPIHRPVILTLKSDDVIHSFWVPNVSGKKDLIPGRSTTLTLRADTPGVYRGQCAEFCGLQHAWMALFVIAQPAAEYDAWAESQRAPAADPAEAGAARGKAVFMASTCVMCHTISGTTAGGRKAPDLSHLASRRTIAAGALPNDAEHLANWIQDPQQYKPGVNMPALQLPPQALQDLVAYLGSLR